MRYTFGNTDTAAERLQRIAGFFNPLARQFIQKHLECEVESAVDLGCGPGYTTRMLAEATGAKKVCGIDQSEFFIQLARQNFPELKFIRNDVTSMNSEKKYNVIYCRFLLSHLNNLNELITLWLTCIHPGGKLIIDELEDILTEVSVFKKYLQISSSLVKSQGAELYVGKKINDAIANKKILVNEINIHPVKNWMAAGWFYGNTIGPWKQEDFIKKNVPESSAKDISEELLRIHTEQSDSTNITWKMRRILLTN